MKCILRFVVLIALFLGYSFGLLKGQLPVLTPAQALNVFSLISLSRSCHFATRYLPEVGG